jgi:hypothetical protein
MPNYDAFPILWILCGFWTLMFGYGLVSGKTLQDKTGQVNDYRDAPILYALEYGALAEAALFSGCFASGVVNSFTRLVFGQFLGDSIPLPLRLIVSFSIGMLACSYIVHFVRTVVLQENEAERDNRTRSFKRVTALLLGFSVTLISLAAGFWVINHALVGQDSYGWPVARVQSMTTTCTRQKVGKWEEKLRLNASYSFLVDGKTLIGKHIYLDDMHRPLFNTAEEVMALRAKLLDQSATLVHYNPANPAENCLQPGVDWGMTAFVLVLIFAVFSLGIVTCVFLSNESRRPAAIGTRDSRW